MRNLLLVLVSAFALNQAAVAGTQTFKLYDEPRHEVSEGCDVYTKLVLTVNGDRATAKVTNELDGFCEILVRPNPRSYELRGEDDGCGSMVFSNGSANVSLVDNRGRLCENIVAATIEFTEGGQTLYSLDF